jgi:hypothetical protein
VEAPRPQDRPLRVDQVGRLRTAGQREVAEHERVLAQLGEQVLARAHGA